MRSYDLIVRFGGDEFICGLADVTVPEATTRFSLVNADLATSHQASITVGLTELHEHDGMRDLIERADQAMYAERHASRG